MPNMQVQGFLCRRNVVNRDNLIAHLETNLFASNALLVVRGAVAEAAPIASIDIQCLLAMRVRSQAYRARNVDGEVLIGILEEGINFPCLDSNDAPVISASGV
jgi:hypothetical protein